MTISGNPLRSLFLEAGVDDRQAVGALQRITLTAQGAEKALLAVARATNAAGRVGMATSANARLAASYNALAVSAAKAGGAMRVASLPNLLYSAATTNPPAYFQATAGGSPLIASALAARGVKTTDPRLNRLLEANALVTGQFPTTATASQRAMARGRGNFGLGTSVFLAGMGLQAGGYAFRQNANLERASLLSSYASGQSPGAMRGQSINLARQFNMRLTAATGLTQEVAQLGVGPEAGRRELARAGAGFNVLESTVGAGEAATSIYRLIKATSRSKEELEAGAVAATRYASAIYAAGNQSAAGAGAVFSMVQELEPLAQFMNLGANGTIALSAAFADLNENQRELFRGALTRMTIEGKLDPNNPIGSLLSIAERLRNAKSDGDKMNLLKALGFDNIRDVQTMAVMAGSMDVFARSLAAVNSELTGVSTFDTKIGKVLATQSGLWDDFRRSLDTTSASIMGNLAPALGLVLSLLTGLSDTIGDNPALGMLVGVGAVGMAGMGVRGLYRRHFGMGNLAQTLASRGISGAEHTAASLSLMSTMPFGGRYAEGLAATGIGQRMALGIGKGAGLGRTSQISLGLLNALPFGERMAGWAAGKMAAGAAGESLMGRTMIGATSPVGWIITALAVGAPLFQKMGDFFNNLASKAGALGIVLNTVSLIFDVLAAGGRILNKVFGWVGDVFGGILKGIFGNDVFTDANSGMSGLHKGISGFLSDDPKAGAQTPAAPSVGDVNIFTGGSRTGFQMGIDEAARRAARTMPSSSSGGLVI